MKNTFARTLFTIIVSLFLVFAVFGQEGTEEPDMPDMEMTEEVDMGSDMEMTEEANMDEDMAMDTTSGAIDITLEELAGNSEEYFGQRVTIQGAVETFINAKTFILGEEALFDNDRLIAFNMTNETFDLRLSTGNDVIVTGVILPSFSIREDGVDETAFWQSMTEIEVADMVDFQVNPLDYYYSAGLEDQYDVFTVLVIEDVQNVSILEDEMMEEETDMGVESTIEPTPAQ
ncbi:MAG: hypothetical protein Phog2KO_17860 [Phototrophicaceae bacterium]